MSVDGGLAGIVPLNNLSVVWREVREGLRPCAHRGEKTGNGEIRGFFAALRMTNKEETTVALLGERFGRYWRDELRRGPSRSKDALRMTARTDNDTIA